MGIGTWTVAEIGKGSGVENGNGIGIRDIPKGRGTHDGATPAVCATGRGSDLRETTIMTATGHGGEGEEEEAGRGLGEEA